MADEKTTISHAPFDLGKAQSQETVETNPVGGSVSLIATKAVNNLSSEPSTSSIDSKLLDLPDELYEVIPPLVMDFISQDLEAFAQYSQVLSQVQEKRSEDSITELLDFSMAFLNDLMLDEMHYKDAMFVVNLCEKIRSDLKEFEDIVSPEFMQIAHSRILLTEYSLPHGRSALLDLEAAHDRFHSLTQIRLNNPVLERQRRYLLFMAQTEGLYFKPSQDGQGWGSYYDYNILHDVLALPLVGKNASMRNQITVAKIDIAASLEYARRDFISSSKDHVEQSNAINDSDVLARYNETLSCYEEKLSALDSLVKGFEDELNAGDMRYIAMLKRRFDKDKQRIPWRYDFTD